MVVHSRACRPGYSSKPNRPGETTPLDQVVARGRSSLALGDGCLFFDNREPVASYGGQNHLRAHYPIGGASDDCDGLPRLPTRPRARSSSSRSKSLGGRGNNPLDLGQHTCKLDALVLAPPRPHLLTMPEGYSTANEPWPCSPGNFRLSDRFGGRAGWCERAAA